jgi:hypothetical protein
MFYALADAIPSGPLDVAKAIQVCGEHGVKIRL